MKLNTKKTIFVGLAFMSISIFWQAYDGVISKILVNEFGISEVAKGFVMGIDNILAVFMLPIFGMLSDKTRSKMGKRTPYIIFGTLGVLLPLMFIPLSIHLGSLPLFFVALGVVLVIMSVYRSPAVALMPDVTLKPLRSKGNAIINLMGAVGGTFALGLITFLYKDGTSSFPFFIAIGISMLVCVGVFFFKVKEPKLLADLEIEKKNLGYTEEDETEEEKGVTEKLPKDKKKSLTFILISIFLWFMAYNAVTTGYSVYAQEVLNLSDGAFAPPLMIANVAAIVMFIPIGQLASKIGRKKTILGGVITLGVAFTLPIFLTADSAFLMYPAFILAGFGWAAINVNSLPMVVEMAKGSTLGKFTGMYYTFSMAAQIVTPMLSGLVMEIFGKLGNITTVGGTFADYRLLFPYAVVFVILAFVTMLFVKHGDSVPIPPKSKIDAYEDL